MFDLGSALNAIGRRCLSTSAFAVLFFAAAGCNVSRFISSNGDSPSNSAVSEKKASNPSDSAAGLCSNAYFPVGQAVSKKYRVSGLKTGSGDREYTESFSNFSGDGFTVDTDFGEVKAHINWRCTADGLLATQYNNSLNMTKTGASAKIETVESSGVSLPPEDQWATGKKWHAEYRVIETLSGPGGGEMGRGDGTIKQDGEIVGSESITVPAGTFDTIKTQMNTELAITVKVKSISVPMNVQLKTTAWFAKGTGMVKSVTETESIGESTSELLSISK